jgi:predicted transporter
MEAKELFSAAIRVIGLLSILRGLGDLMYVVLYETGGSEISVTAKFPSNDMLLGIFYFFLGLYFLRGASLIVDYAFPVRPAYLDLSAPEDHSSADEDQN